MKFALADNSTLFLSVWKKFTFGSESNKNFATVINIYLQTRNSYKNHLLSLFHHNLWLLCAWTCSVRVRGTFYLTNSISLFYVPPDMGEDRRGKFFPGRYSAIFLTLLILMKGFCFPTVRCGVSIFCDSATSDYLFSTSKIHSIRVKKHFLSDLFLGLELYSSKFAASML